MKFDLNFKVVLVFSTFFLGFFNLCFCQNSFPKREFRAAWIVTAYNVDWPSVSGLSSEEQKKEFLQQIDILKKAGINAVIVQVRTCGDAFYGKGRKEPWSKFLSGLQGIEPTYDPLQFMIDEAHNRGMELHAWINIDRAKFKYDSIVAPWHIAKTHPDWLYQYGENFYFNFGLPQVREYLSSIPAEIAKNYDIDGIHLDEYYYPFPIKDDSLRDEPMFKKYPNGMSNINDWRRKNSEMLVRDIYKKIKNVKPNLPFGISPFPIWRNEEDDPRGSKTFAKTSSYGSLFADIDTWIRKGYVDYVAPQIYFTRYFNLAPYEELLSWWSQYDSLCPVFVGHSVFRIGTAGSLGRDTFWFPEEMPAQITLNRTYSGIDGSIFYSSNDLIKNKGGILDSLGRSLYKYPAICPVWKGNENAKAPERPQNIMQEVVSNQVRISWDKPSANEEQPFTYIIYRFDENTYPDYEDGRNIAEIISGDLTHWTDPKPLTQSTLYAVSAVNRKNLESKPFLFLVKK